MDNNQFYKIKYDVTCCDISKNQYLLPTLEGSKLLAAYYKLQKDCSISFTYKESSYQTVPSVSLMDLLKAQEFVNKKQIPSNYRHAFLYGMDDIHAIPVIYIKEHDEEGILIANSLGAGYGLIELAKSIKKELGIFVYVVENSRQADFYSCFNDALIFARDATGKNKVSGHYIIPDLLAKLKKRGSPYNKETELITVKLPDELLKTCQMSSFYKQHKEEEEENQGRIIHKHETLSLFRTRYTDRDVQISVNVGKKLPPSFCDLYSYPRLKGLKWLNTLQIQFYLEQIRTALKDEWDGEGQQLFIDEAKQAIKGQQEESAIANILYHKSYEFMIAQRDKASYIACTV